MTHFVEHYLEILGAHCKLRDIPLKIGYTKLVQKTNAPNTTMLKNIPNALTAFRLLLIIPFLVSLYRQAYPSAFYLYLLAGVTDGIDGWLARLYKWQSNLGSFIDPLADKLLIASSFISLALLSILPWWLVILVFMRDLTISMGVMAWYWFVATEIELKRTLMSKFNTAIQITLVTFCLFELAFFKFSSEYVTYLIILTTITTCLTYVNYVWTWGKKACAT